MARRSASARGAGAAPKLAIAGHLNIDHHLHVDRLPDPDRTVAVRRRHAELGGTAANLARAARREGVPVGIISRVGDDFPAEYRATLRAEGIDLAGVESVAGAGSPSCVIVHDDRGSQVTFIDQGPMADARSAPVPQRLLATCRWVHLGTGDPEYLARIQRWSRAHGVRVAFDPAQEIHYRWTAEALRSALDASELFFGNQAEAERARSLLGLSRVSDLTAHAPTVVVTHGRRGVVAYTRRGRTGVPAVAMGRVTDPTGAGDAFRGGFYGGWLAGRALDDCLSAGTRAAASWLRRRHPTRGGNEG